MNDCQECGMLIEDAKEYHPYAACLMFMGCRDSEKVRANLAGVIAHGAQYQSGFDDMADRIAQLEAALRKAHGVIRSCVTSGVLRHDLNCFLAEESSVLENEVSK